MCNLNASRSDQQFLEIRCNYRTTSYQLQPVMTCRGSHGYRIIIIGSISWSFHVFSDILRSFVPQLLDCKDGFNSPSPVALQRSHSHCAVNPFMSMPPHWRLTSKEGEKPRHAKPWIFGTLQNRERRRHTWQAPWMANVNVNLILASLSAGHVRSPQCSKLEAFGFLPSWLRITTISRFLC